MVSVTKEQPNLFEDICGPSSTPVRANLKALQQDVRDLDNDLLETDNCIEQLRYLAQQYTMFGSTGDDPAGAASRVHSGRLHDSGSAISLPSLSALRI